MSLISHKSLGLVPLCLLEQAGLPMQARHTGSFAAPRDSSAYQNHPKPVVTSTVVTSILYQAATVSFSEHWREDVDSYLSGKTQEDYVIYDRQMGHIWAHDMGIQ